MTATVWNSTPPDASNFYVGDGSQSMTNVSGTNYTALLFGHDTSSTGRIQCGSYTGNSSASGPTVSLGWDPRWVMIKNRGTTGQWYILDQARSAGFSGNDWYQAVSGNSADTNILNVLSLTGTGFQIVTNSSVFNGNSATYLYVAIR